MDNDEESFYWWTICAIVELIRLNGYDRVMADVQEILLREQSDYGKL